MRKLIPALLVAALLLGLFAVAANAQVAYQVFENIRARTVTTVGDTTIGDDLDVVGGLTGTTANFSGNINADGAMIVTDYAALQDDLYLIPADPITVTNGGTITPTTAMVELTAAGAVGADLAPCGDGQLYIFLNTANQTITISDTSTTRLAGNAALGQWDSLTVIGSGVSCNEVARANN